jgi:DNA-binding response OmpR family regulator
MKKRVLIVEDDSNLAAFMRENLLYEGFDVNWAADGNSAQMRARTFMPDLIVLDIMLPDTSGFELCAALRRNGRVPVLIVSARSDKTDKLRGLNLGADDYITKPFDLDEFVARVHAYSEGRARPLTISSSGRSLSISLPERRRGVMRRSI